MLYTPEVFNDKIPTSYGTYVPVKQTYVSKSLRKISETLDVKPNTTMCILCDAKSKLKVIRAGSMLWYSIPKR